MCGVLKSMLDSNGIAYQVEMDTSVMLNKGITHVPMLECDDGKLLCMSEAIAYIRGEKDVR